MILTAQQKQAMIMIEKFIADKDSQVFILKGYAGTGKTTLIRSIADYLSTQSLHIQLMAPDVLQKYYVLNYQIMVLLLFIGESIIFLI